MTEWMNQHPGLLLLILAWSLAWKGFGLWRAAEFQHKRWFIAILVLNTLGILEMIYLYFIARKHKIEVAEN